MKNRIFWGLALLILLFWAACKQTPPPYPALLVRQKAAAVQDQPGLAGKTVARLQAGESVYDLGEVSSFVTTLVIADTVRTEPWLLVETRDGKRGWVFAGAVSPAEAPEDSWRRGKLLTAHLGPGPAARLRAWSAVAGQGMAHEQEFAAHYREIMSLRDTLVALIRTGTERAESPDSPPDFFWLNAEIPGLIVQRLPQGGGWHLFADYRFWHAAALATDGKQDDALVEAALLAFPADSIESFFPSWTIQTGEWSGCSQLGLGKHHAMLQALERCRELGGLFEPECRDWKTMLLEDILGKNVDYWQPADKIVAELHAILHSAPGILDARDSMSLATRKTMFEQAEHNEIRTNVRSGEE